MTDILNVLAEGVVAPEDLRLLREWSPPVDTIETDGHGTELAFSVDEGEGCWGEYRVLSTPWGWAARWQRWSRLAGLIAQEWLGLYPGPEQAYRASQLHAAARAKRAAA